MIDRVNAGLVIRETNRWLKKSLELVKRFDSYDEIDRLDVDSLRRSCREFFNECPGL